MPSSAMGKGRITGPRISLSVILLMRACTAGGKSGPRFPGGPKGLKFMPAMLGIGEAPDFFFFGFVAALVPASVTVSKRLVVPLVESMALTEFVADGGRSVLARALVVAFAAVAAG